MKLSLWIAIVALGSASLPALATGGGTSVNSPGRVADAPAIGPVYEVLAPSSVNLRDNNHVFATYQLSCRHSLVQPVRADIDNPAQHRVDLLVGALVTDDLTSNCRGTSSVTLDAGPAYSGRAYEVMPLSAPVRDSLPSAPAYRVVPLDHYALDKPRPLHLEASFQVPCSDSFVQVVRFDIPDSATGHQDIVLGGLVLEDPAASCAPNHGARMATRGAGVVTAAAFDVKPLYPR